ncbi:MAG: DUF6455 family protein [Pseudomonadota bacterium]
MQSRQVLKHHAELVDRMAQTVGVDLETAVMKGQLPPEEITDAVLRCTGCTNPEHCGQWLNETEHADAPLGYCRNAEMLKRLQV